MVKKLGLICLLGVGCSTNDPPPAAGTEGDASTHGDPATTGGSEAADETGSGTDTSDTEGPGPTGALEFDPPGGVFFAPFELQITTVLEGTIRYTEDGSPPTASSPEWNGATMIDATTHIRAAVFAGDEAMAPRSAAYLRVEPGLSHVSNLPVVVIETWDQQDLLDDPERPRDFHPVYGVFFDVDESGQASIENPPSFAGRGGMHIRGNSTVEYPKKQYNLEIRHEDESDRAVTLLGMPEESDWVLHAPYSDKTLMRNYLIYTWSNRIGRYAARTSFIEVYIDHDGSLGPDDYVGVYAWMEKVKVDDQRVAIDRLESGHDTLPAVSGGYLLQRDWVGEEPELTLTTAVYDDTLLFKSPKHDAATQPQIDFITNYLDEFEGALSGPGFDDEETGYAQYIDVDSFIDHHLLVELGRNVDGYVLSTFMHKPREGKLHMGPVWDYNGALGNADYFEADDPEGWHFDNPEFPADNPNGYHWYARLFEDPAFGVRYAQRWQELRAGPLSNESLLQDIEDAAVLLESGGAVDRNFERWPVLGESVWPNDPGAEDRQTFEDEIAYLQSWLTARLAWMDSQLL